MSDETEQRLSLITHHSSLKNQFRHLRAHALRAAWACAFLLLDAQALQVLARGDALEAAFADELFVDGGPAARVGRGGGHAERGRLAVHRAARAHYEGGRGDEVRPVQR